MKNEQKTKNSGLAADRSAGMHLKKSQNTSLGKNQEFSKSSQIEFWIKK